MKPGGAVSASASPAVQAKKRAPVLLAISVLVAMLVFIAGVAWGLSSAVGRAEQVALRFAEALRAGDTEAAYALLDSKAKAALSPSEFDTLHETWGRYVGPIRAYRGGVTGWLIGTRDVLAVVRIRVYGLRAGEITLKVRVWGGETGIYHVEFRR